MNGITTLNSQAAMGEEAHANKTAVTSMEKRVATGPGMPMVWSVGPRVDEEPHNPRIGAVEKRADEDETPDLWAVEKRADEDGTPDLWAVEKRASAGAKIYQAKRANYPTPQSLRPDA